MIPEKIQERIVLASKSPRRSHLMREAGYDFQVIVPNAEEDFDEKLPNQDIPEQVAFQKSRSFGEVPEDMLLITADTMVFLDDDPLGKPKDRDHAFRMLQSLSDRSHQVITGVCIRRGEERELFHARTDVHFRELKEEELEHYIDQYQPYDKAGAYGIQEWIGHIAIDRIEGSYFNVMGLPISQLHLRIQKLLRKEAP